MTLVSNITLMGSALGNNLVSAMTKAEISGSHTDVTQLELDIVDPGWKLLGSGLFQLGMTVVADKFNLEIASIDTGGSGSQETVTIKARPLVVRRIKNRKGRLVMNNISPTEYLQKICSEVGAPLIAQPSARLPNITRDFTPPGRQELRFPKNDWTTMVRLARKIGFFFFEAAGTIFFGQPSWLIANVPSTVAFNYDHTPANPICSIPVCNRSEDAVEVTVAMDIRVSTASALYPGQRFRIGGIPQFSDDYILSQIRLDLLDQKSLCNVTATNPVNPLTEEEQGQG